MSGYRPILRFKRGEQTALTNLSDAHKAATKPLLNITPHSFNPPPGTETDGTFDQRITQDADRLCSAWAGYAAAVDLNDLDPDARCAGGIHPVERFFEQVSASETPAVASPVLRLTSESAYLAAVAATCATHGVAPVFRLTPDDLAEHDVETVVREMLDQCEADPSVSDMVVDMSYIATSGRSIITARGALAVVPFAADWLALTLAAGSFPENLSGFSVGTHRVERHEWAVWLSNQNSAGRPVLYGDYATIHPIPVDEGLDPRTMNPTASVRYTHDNTWILLRGQGTRTRGGPGFSQFLHHADTLVAMSEYRGQSFSFGDGRIMSIHQRQEGQGNLETWVTIGVNHHLVEIVDQLSSLP